MARKKGERHKQIDSSPYIIQTWTQQGENICWTRQQSFFKNNSPITLELACWRWEYSVWLWTLFPERNFIGVDIKGERLRHGAESTKKQWLKNVWFLRSKIHFLQDFFEENEVDEIRIVHPDPRSKWADERRRLTHQRFLDIYKHILKPKGTLRLKTDDANLFFYSYRSLQNAGRKIHEYTRDLYNSPLLNDHHDIKTHYEKKFVQEWRTIHYLIAENTK